MNKKRMKLVILLTLFLVLGGLGFTIYYEVHKTMQTSREMFKLNSKRRAEGYYMAEFEFKMIGVLYLLDRGEYSRALSLFDKLHEQLKTGKGLVKVPEFKNKGEELDFYLNQQNPETGAFMDDAYPLCTYFPPTINVIEHMAQIADGLGQPLKLKYPLKFLEQLNSPAELKTYLDDLAGVGWFVSKMPKTPYVISHDLVGYHLLEELNLYSFSEEWKNELIKWHWDAQDPETGYWGARLRSNGKLIDGGDLSVTPSILKLFMDREGKTLNENYPLRYKKQMFETTLRKFQEPLPESVSEQHAWSIDITKGVSILTVYLWDSLTEEQKVAAKKEIEKILEIVFSKFYIPEQGAFSLYAGEKKADLDGTGGFLGLMQKIGFFSTEKQQEMWGFPDKTIKDIGIIQTSDLKDNDFKPLYSMTQVNSYRFYRTVPGKTDYLSNVAAVFYPRKSQVPDVIEMTLALNRWLENTSQHMGNWTSKESIVDRMSSFSLSNDVIIQEKIPIETTREILHEKGKLVIIGFDRMQIPRFRISIVSTGLEARQENQIQRY